MVMNEKKLTGERTQVWTNAVDQGKDLFDSKAQIRRTIEAEGIPHTFVVANLFTRHILPTLSDLGAMAASIDRVIILGDGNTKESSFPINIGLSICHASYVKGDHTNYEIEPSFGVEASELYLDVKYTTLDEFFNENDACTPFYLNQFILINDIQNFE
ncbi:Isoflavone reductase-like [Spatholobus suberectus]|nr:Isoflavone reductase-like [Spatholobus suberectus]